MDLTPPFKGFVGKVYFPGAISAREEADDEEGEETSADAESGSVEDR
jgi:hypothetical protein